MKNLSCITMGLVLSLSCFAKDDQIDRFDFYFSQSQYNEVVRLKARGITSCFSFLTVQGKTIPFTETVMQNYLPTSKYQDFEKVAENIIIDKNTVITKKCS